MLFLCSFRRLQNSGLDGSTNPGTICCEVPGLVFAIFWKPAFAAIFEGLWFEKMGVHYRPLR